MALLAFMVTRLFDGGGQEVLLVWLGGCTLLVAVPLLLVTFAMRAYRRYATPLADVMAAADAVADGDFTVRVSERAPGEFAGLARSFNRMAAELELSDRRRRNLTADVAHELRTPLHIIQGNLEGILDGVYESSPQHLEATLDETRALGRLVTDLQTIAQAEAGQLHLDLQPVRIDELLADLETSFGPLASNRGITLSTTNGGTDTGPIVLGDAGRLDQVLVNLVSNALRHTPAGGAIALHGAANGRQVVVTVTDTGEGIAAEDLPFVFDRFWRGDRARTHSDGVGGGLGLAIARQIIDQHGGSISVTSQPHAGATFRIVLPAMDT